MQQAETLVSACAGGSIDRKITCETLANKTDPPERHPDSPPESFWLSKDEEHDWFDRNALYERKESTKGSTSSSTTNSQRFSLNLKSRIIGLPKPQKPSFTDAKNRRNHKPCNNIKLFPKRSVSVTKSVTSHAEPSSPKVSCMGRVRSKRDRSRSRSLRLRNSRKSSIDAGEENPGRIGRKHGFFERFRAIFRSGRRKKAHRETDSAAEDSTVTNSVVKARDSTASVNDASFAESISSEPPGLGGMMRFASGRRSESWGVGESEIHVSR
ncbi:uncharacterized protein LOC130730197 [Lotus japonicus]|uniref:uncharacterized protein LOC130730197 n=1 Tax=Lotus japonicus TaxID=34305 RepID=UPI002588BC29|nr:uncharacterized protein LOC130730197 [Lotus japonicus]